MVKYPGQCVALQRDSGSRYTGNGPGLKNEELLWSVVAALGVDLAEPVLWGGEAPLGPRAVPQGELKYGPEVPLCPLRKTR